MKLEPTKTLAQACREKYVVRNTKDYAVSNQYYQWCSDNSKPFVTVTIKPQSRYAAVELDLYSFTLDGFSADAGYRILQFLLDTPMKRSPDMFVSTFDVSPIYVDATHVRIDRAIPTALFLYQIAVTENVVRTQQEMIDTLLERSETGLDRERRFKPISVDVHPLLLAKLRTLDHLEAAT